MYLHSVILPLYREVFIITGGICLFLCRIQIASEYLKGMLHSCTGGKSEGISHDQMKLLKSFLPKQHDAVVCLAMLYAVTMLTKLSIMLV